MIIQESLINVDFDFFDPNPKVDYLALKRLITQLFQGDAESLIPNALADLILSQPLLGSTIKTDGIESDPLAYLSVLNMHVHQVGIHPYILSYSICISNILYSSRKRNMNQSPLFVHIYSPNPPPCPHFKAHSKLSSGLRASNRKTTSLLFSVNAL